MIESEGDLVDRIVDYLSGDGSLKPALDVERLKAALRVELGGVRGYVRTGHEARRRAIARAALEEFNGRNATEVARRLGIGRVTVYRIIKQARREKVSPGGKT